MRRLVKVCGMRKAENIRAVEALGVDMMGFILYPKSPRYVETLPEYMPNVERVGVFVNEDLAVVEEKIKIFGLDWVQLHGAESPDYCASLGGVRVIKAISISTAEDLQLAKKYEGVCERLLFDTKCDGHGGSGVQFDWSILSAYDGDTPFLLSGGIGVEGVAGFDHPKLIGYDINSRFEIATAEKDTTKIEQFLKEIKMNRINELFASDKKDILSIYFCAGTPTVDGTVEVIEALEQSGVSMVEIGIPFSDPMADGVVIQAAATDALRNGMSLRLLFSQLADVRKSVTIPLVLMGYLNPIMQFGFENFCQRCKECGIDGVIIPDLPFADYQASYRATAEQYDVKVIMLITPETSEERIREIDDNTDGFIYMVSSAATTGAQADFNAKKIEYFERINSLALRNPRMIGFGISNNATFRAACDNARGGIIGSYFVSELAKSKNPREAIAAVIGAIEA